LEDWGLDWVSGSGVTGGPLLVFGIVTGSFDSGGTSGSSFFSKSGVGGGGGVIFFLFLCFVSIFLCNFTDRVIVVSDSFLSNGGGSDNSVSKFLSISKWNWLFCWCCLWDGFWCVRDINFLSGFVDGFLRFIIWSLKSISNKALGFSKWLSWCGSFFSGFISGLFGNFNGNGSSFSFWCISWSSWGSGSWCSGSWLFSDLDSVG
jgi:hypothetical protein